MGNPIKEKAYLTYFFTAINEMNFCLNQIEFGKKFENKKGNC